MELTIDSSSTLFSEMVFSPNISQEFKEEIQKHLHVKISDGIQKYLGMPTQFGRSKEQDFHFIMERIWKKHKGWKKKCLSFEGRGVLIKAVAQAIPTYYMSCFMLPKGLCTKIEKAICSFWWGTTDKNKKMHWVSKKKLFRSKHSGGLGFKTLRDFNLAMLAKKVWRFYTNPNSLIAKCFKANYYPHTDILQAKVGNYPSYAWKSIQNAIWVISKGSCWRIGDGGSINIWEDNWVPTYKGLKVMTTKGPNHFVNRVKDLINSQESLWNKVILEDQFISIDIDQISQIPLINTTNPDSLMWMHDPTGIYSVKSGYNTLRTWQTQQINNTSTSSDETLIWKKIWSLHTIPRHKVLLWRILNDSLPVRSSLRKRGIQCYPLCPRCHSKTETITHLFMSCPLSKRVWFGSNLCINFDNLPNPNFIN